MGARTVTTYFAGIELRGVESDNIRAILVDGTRLAVVFYLPEDGPMPRESLSILGRRLCDYAAPAGMKTQGAAWALDLTAGQLPIRGTIPSVWMSELADHVFGCDGIRYVDAHDAVANIGATIAHGKTPGEGLLVPQGDFPVEAPSGSAAPGAHAGFERDKWSYPPFISTTIL